MSEQRTANSDQAVPQPAALSADAARLHEYLLRWCTAPEKAKTHREIARALALSERSIIELAEELLKAEILVIARCKPPCGCWILTDEDTDHYHELDGELYACNLHDRGVSVLARERYVRRALYQRNARRLVETSGQRRLF